jgi:hypothetical protein
VEAEQVTARNESSDVVTGQPKIEQLLGRDDILSPKQAGEGDLPFTSGGKCRTSRHFLPGVAAGTAQIAVSATHAPENSTPTAPRGQTDTEL